MFFLYFKRGSRFFVKKGGHRRLKDETQPSSFLIVALAFTIPRTAKKPEKTRKTA